MYMRGLLAKMLAELSELEVSVDRFISGKGNKMDLDEQAQIISQRPLHAHPLALVIHASALTLAMEGTRRDSRGHPVTGDAAETAAATIGGITYGTTVERRLF